MAYNTQYGVTVTINENRVAGISEVGKQIVKEWNNEVSPPTLNTVKMVVVLKRKRYLNDTHSDRVNIMPFSNFILAVTKQGVTETYRNCEWLDYKETVSDDNSITEEVYIEAKSITVT